MAGLHLPTLITAHAWVLMALTILVGALYRVAKDPGPKYWFYSDLCGLLSLVAFYFIIVDTNRIGFFLFSISTQLTMYYRVLAVSRPNFTKSFKRFAIPALTGIVLMNILLNSEWIVIRTFLNSIIFAIFCACLIYSLIWAHDFRGRVGRLMVLASAIAYMSVALLRAFYVLKSDANYIFIANPFNTVSSTILMLLGILANIGYVIMILDELNRAEVEAVQNLIRETERRRHAEERERESAELAEEQKRLIEILTHEVRQPLNNASAALQSIGAELNHTGDKMMHRGVTRAQAVIDRVSAALANALVAATILERRQSFNPVRYDPALLVEMVALDFTKAERSRVQVNTQEAPLYVTADPILLRIALRNLLDNALRYSPPHSQVSISVHENDVEMGAEFRVSNLELDPKRFPDEDIFARRVRGRSAEVGGSGMGLYITSEVAKLHGGWLKTMSEPQSRIFSFFIED